MSRRAKLTDQQREERRQADRQRLQAAVSALLSSEGWAQWIRVRARNGLGGRYSWVILSGRCPRRLLTSVVRW